MEGILSIWFVGWWFTGALAKKLDRPTGDFKLLFDWPGELGEIVGDYLLKK